MRKIFSATFAAIFFCLAMIVSAADFQYIAPLSLHWLARAGVPEAHEYIKNLRANDAINPSDVKNFARVEKANAIYRELKYAALNNFIQSEGYKNILELGCGVSPRGIFLARKGMNYVGADLEAVANIAASCAPNFLTDTEKKNISFAAADVTDREAMLTAAKNFPGKVCIVEEELAQNLSRTQQRAMLENIRDILKIHGGCFVTSDYTSREIFMESAAAVYGKKTAEEIASETKKIYENTSEPDFSQTIFESQKDALNFFRDEGFRVEMRPLLTKTQQLHSLQSLNDEQIKSVQKVAGKKFLWVVTLK